MKKIHITEDFCIDKVGTIEDNWAEQILYYSNGIRKTSGKVYTVDSKERFVKLFEKDKKEEIKNITKEIKQLQNKLRRLKILDSEEFANEINWS